MYKCARLGVCVLVVILPFFGNAANVVETAVADGNFKTLAAALTKANLVDTLSGDGPFTVFAPTDTAFEAALAALKITQEELLARADLADILKFHVASGKVMSTDLSNGQKVKTLQGAELTVTIDGKTVKIGDATVTIADLGCSNGVIHVIDKVQLPPAPAAAAKNIVETAVANGSFKTLAAALTKAKLVDALSGEGPLTVFAPTDAAFEEALKALKITADELLARKDLGDILKFHVSSGKVMSSDLKNDMKVATLNGQELIVKIEGGTVKVNDATVTVADVEASNGVIHIIDKVLLPAAKKPAEDDGAVSGATSHVASLTLLLGGFLLQMVASA